MMSMDDESPEELIKMTVARDQLRAAIENYLRVYEWDGSTDGDPRMLTDYVVLTATQGFTKEGDSVTGHPYILCEGMPLYRALGLVEVCTVLMAGTMEEPRE